MKPEEAAALRAPFPPEAIGKIPKGGVKLDYVGHAAVTDRLLKVDPSWTWEPVAVGEFGQPVATDGGLWIRMTVCGVSRLGWGDGPDMKQKISDAIRNAAMRFGVALDLWAKEDISDSPRGAATPQSAEPASPAGSAVPKHKRDALKSRCVALQADGVSIADAREEIGLPLVDSCDPAQFEVFTDLVEHLEARLESPFEPAEA